MITCNTCFSDFLIKCNDVINVKAQLLPATNYIWIIEDKFGHEFQGTFTTDEDGFWEIPVSDLPAGMLTEFSGVFFLRVQRESGNCSYEVMKIAGEYECIQFDIHGGTRIKDTLGCVFNSNTSTEGDISELIPFIAQEEVTVLWTPTRLLNFGNNPQVRVHHSLGGGLFELVSVPVTRVTVDGVLTQLVIDNGVSIDGYILLS